METPWKTALVTGASSGLGRGLAVWLAKRGVTVWAAARREKNLEALKAEVGERIVPVVMDVRDGTKTFNAVQRLDHESGGLDLVIANAGVSIETRASRFDWAEEEQQLQVNVTGAVATMMGAVKGMVERRRGHLVAISSLAGLVPLPKYPGYCASKAYLRMYLDSLRFDVERFGVHCTSIHPGFVKSEITAKLKDGKLPFLMETEAAVERMGRAMLRRTHAVTFPWQLSSLIELSEVLPGPVRRSILRKVK